MEAAYVGIDVAMAKGKRLPICICVRRAGALVPLALRDRNLPKPPAGMGNAKALNPETVSEFAAATLAYLSEISHQSQISIHTVALDCPSAPRPDQLPRRAAEVAMDSMRIRCFTTPSRSELEEIRAKVQAHLDCGGPQSRIPHANQLWMLAGFELFKALEPRYECREVFPQAIVRSLGVDGSHKSKVEGYRAQLVAAAYRTGMNVDELEPGLKVGAWGSMHDRLDAYLCAWIASLPEVELEACGNPPDDVIWVPAASA